MQDQKNPPVCPHCGDPISSREILENECWGCLKQLVDPTENDKKPENPTD